MIRFLARRLQAATPAAGATGGGGAGGNTSSASGRLIAIRKKAKWLERRSKKVPHQGKDVFAFGESPSCELCQVRFRWKQDFQAHKDSELHMNRVRWVETQTWWDETGAPAHRDMEENSWKWFNETVIPKKAAEEGITAEAARRNFRKAIMRETPKCHRQLQAPKMKAEIKEPRDQRWPSSPKW